MMERIPVLAVQVSTHHVDPGSLGNTLPKYLHGLLI